MAPKPSSVTMVVKNLPVGCSEQDVFQLCGPTASSIAEVEFPARTQTFTKYCFAFVRFFNLKDALTCIERLNKFQMQGRRLIAQLGHSHHRNTNQFTVPQDTDGPGPQLVQEEDDEEGGGPLCSAVESLMDDVHHASGNNSNNNGNNNNNNSSISSQELNATILHYCRTTWNAHRRKYPQEGLPTFGKVMNIISKMADTNDESGSSSKTNEDYQKFEDLVTLPSQCQDGV
ncbi:unnamed protein product [Meganyctiphanes norvegica]|uniref:RRM domain-containing protein n=1 Tax=Meganyctiphanes norvegica TaxID=48144 RepID=A0AAV2QW51_MEGNR